jgi:toxin ParE1/3/4
MKPVAQHAAATLEMEDAARWYECEAGMGERFFAAVNEAKAFIRRHPQLGTPQRRGTRKWRVKGFPYLLIYRDEPERVFVVSVAHGNRKPGFWESRLD